MTLSSSASTPAVLLIGAGHLGSYHLQKLRLLEAEGVCRLVGVVEPDESRQAQLLSEGTTVWRSLSEVTSLFDAALVASPTETHGGIARRLLEKKVHLLVEKPLCTSHREGEEIAYLAKDSACHLWVGHVEEYNPVLLRAKELLDEPYYIVAERLSPFTGRSANTDIVMDLMIHDLEVIASICDAPLRRVDALGAPVLTDALDMVSARLEFENGLVAQLSATRVSLEAKRNLRCFTRTQYLSIDFQEGGLKQVFREDTQQGPQIGANAEDVPKGDALLTQDRAFLRAVASEAPSQHLEAVRALDWAERIHRAVAEHATRAEITGAKSHVPMRE